jgi:hypothetical protein
MTDLHQVRDAIEILLAALSGEAKLADGLTLQIGPRLDMTLTRRETDPKTSVLSFQPPPAVHYRRGALHLRCKLTAVTISSHHVHATIEGWLDRHWRVVS